MRFPERARLALSRAADLLFPPSCAFCERLLAKDRTAVGFCAECSERLPRIGPPFCLRCGIPFGAFDGSETPQTGGHACGQCISKPPPFERARAPLRYEGVARDVILRFKYGRDFSVLKALEEILWNGFAAIKLDVPAPDVLCPVPLHPSRLRERHFDQARILCSRLARRVGIPASLESLRRTRKTDFQAPLSRGDRLRNVKGAFGPGKPEAVRGKRVLLIDDVYTTGATACECAHILLQDAGAKAVDVLCVAMAVPE